MNVTFSFSLQTSVESYQHLSNIEAGSSTTPVPAAYSSVPVLA
jgi:hypothetical protein